jgi:hypothetical protein
MRGVAMAGVAIVAVSSDDIRGIDRAEVPYSLVEFLLTSRGPLLLLPRNVVLRTCLMLKGKEPAATYDLEVLKKSEAVEHRS